MKSLVYDKAYQFSIRIVNAYRYLSEEKSANISEANGAISKADFRAKMSIAYQEYLETKYWLSLLKDTGYISLKAFESIYKDAEEISKMLWRILKSSNLQAYNKSKLN